MLSKRTLAAITALICAVADLAHGDQTLPPGTDEFTINGRRTYVILPEPEDVVSTDKIPWLWYCPSDHNLPGTLEQWMIAECRSRGVAVAGIDLGGNMGTPVGRAILTTLYDELTQNRGFSEKPCMIGRSYGGLQMYTWAAENAESVGGLAGIYPVCNYPSYPGIDRTAGFYGVSVAEMWTILPQHNPIDNLAPLAAANVPIYHNHGDVDGLVPMADNSSTVQTRYEALGGSMTLEVLVGQGHNYNPAFFESQGMADFIVQNAIIGAGSDVTAPSVTALSPADGATGASLGGKLTVTFNEFVQKGAAGNITIKRTSDDVVFETIPANSSKITIIGPDVIIDPTGTLAANTAYSVQIENGAIEDVASPTNAFPGIADTTPWNFTAGPPDGTAPSATSLIPGDDDTNVTANSNLVIQFDEDIQKGSGDIVITETGGGILETIPATDSRVSVSGAVVTINPNGVLTYNTAYHVEVSSGAFKDLADNPWSGISGASEWNYIAEPPPLIAPITVQNASFETAGSNPDWVPGWSANTGNFRTRTSIGTLSPTDGVRQAWMSDGTYGYQDTGHIIVAGATYTLTVDFGADQNNFPDLEGVSLRLYGSDLGFDTPLAATETIGPATTQWLHDQTVSVLVTPAMATGQTLGIYLGVSSGTQAEWDNVRLVSSTPSGEDTTAPILTGKVPVDGATGVAANTNIEATFSEAVQLGASGNITLDHLSGGVDVVIDVAAHGGQLSVAGHVLTIDPGTDLAAGVDYAFLFEAGAVTDLAGTPNAFAGISDTTTWNFATVAPDVTDPDISSLSPTDDATGVAVSADFVITFDEDVQKGSGDIVITETGGSIFETIPVGDVRVSVSGAMVTINPDGTLANDTAYHVGIASGVIEDLANNDFPGLTGSTAWNFTTATAPTGGPITVSNFSFEEADIGGQQVQVPTGWSRDGANGGMADRAESTEDDQHIWANGPSAGGPTTFHITLGEEITEGVSYTLTVDVFQTDNFTGSEATIRLFGSDAGFATALAEVAGIAPPQNGTLFNQTVMFTASAGEATGQTLGIALVGSGGIQARFDNVRLTASAPPPTNTFVNWIAGFELDPAEKDFGDDVDGDHLANGVEAWFGTHPGQFDVGISILNSNGTTTTFEHPQNDDPPSDLSGYYEWSPNLNDWYTSGSGPAGGPTVSFVPSTVGTTTLVTATASEALDKLFLRVGVRQLP
ncbi:MAG: Ig-like domain-containing protein [Akkermansiaceae bacterium]|nr:Ig-like domain-containing protein [Akkermansiaceae bacterium]